VAGAQNFCCRQVHGGPALECFVLKRAELFQKLLGQLGVDIPRPKAGTDSTWPGT